MVRKLLCLAALSRVVFTPCDACIVVSDTRASCERPSDLAAATGRPCAGPLSAELASRARLCADSLSSDDRGCSDSVTVGGPNRIPPIYASRRADVGIAPGVRWHLESQYAHRPRSSVGAF